MTRTDHIRANVVAMLEQHRLILDHMDSLSNLRIDVKFDRRDGSVVKVIVWPEMEAYAGQLTT